MEHGMRAAAVFAIAISIPLVTAAAWAQNNATPSERLGTLAQTANPGTCPGNPGSLGVARVVEMEHELVTVVQKSVTVNRLVMTNREVATKCG